MSHVRTLIAPLVALFVTAAVTAGYPLVSLSAQPPAPWKIRIDLRQTDGTLTTAASKLSWATENECLAALQTGTWRDRTLAYIKRALAEDPTVQISGPMCGQSTLPYYQPIDSRGT